LYFNLQTKWYFRLLNHYRESAFKENNQFFEKICFWYTNSCYKTYVMSIHSSRCHQVVIVSYQVCPCTLQTQFTIVILQSFWPAKTQQSLMSWLSCHNQPIDLYKCRWIIKVTQCGDLFAPHPKNKCGSTMLSPCQRLRWWHANLFLCSLQVVIMSFEVCTQKTDCFF
jgi:hypothetical protein